MNRVIQNKKVIADTRTAIAHSGIGAEVRAGAPKPKIFKKKPRNYDPSIVTCTGRYSPTHIICAIPRASLRSVLLICAFSTACMCRVSTHTTGSSASARALNSTDNGVQFSDMPQHRSGPTARYRLHMFDRICREHDIEHRLTKPDHPRTNGQVERMNRTLKEATVRRYHYATNRQLADHLAAFLEAYNFAKRLKTLRGLTPYELAFESCSRSESRSCRCGIRCRAAWGIGRGGPAEKIDNLPATVDLVRTQPGVRGS